MDMVRAAIVRRALMAAAAAAMLGAAALPLSSAGAASSGDTWIGREYRGYCEEAGAEYGICPELLMAIMERESWGVADARNGSCVGLMQVDAAIHAGRAERIGVSDISDPRGNVMVAADYLAELMADCDGDAATALMVYHGERGAMEKGARGEVSAYAEGILNRTARLERMHGK